MYSFSFVILLLIAAVDLLGIGLVYPVFAAMMFDTSIEVVPFGASAGYRGAMLGLLIALTPLMQFISSPVLGAISDVKGRKIVLASGIAVGCAGYFLAVVGVWLDSIWLLLVYRLCVGISEGTVAVAQAALADISTEEDKARRFSILGAALGFGFTIGPFLGGKLSDPASGEWASYAMPFIVAGCLSFLNFLLIVFKLPETRTPKVGATFNVGDSFRSIPGILALTRLRWLFVGGFALSFGWSLFQEFLPVYLQARFAFSSGGVGDYYACCGFWYAVSSGLLTAPLVNRFSADQLVAKALLGCSVVMLGFVILPAAGYIWLVLPVMMFCIALAYPTATAMVSDRADKDVQGEVLGVFHSVQAGAMALSPLLAGSLVGAMPVLAAWGGAATMALAAGAFVVARVRAAAQAIA